MKKILVIGLLSFVIPLTMTADTAMPINSCGEINQAGTYTLSADITGGASSCLKIHDTSQVYINCNNHAVIMDLKGGATADSIVSVKNVQNFSLQSCTIKTANNSLNWPIWGVRAEDSSTGVIKNNDFTDTIVEADRTSGLKVTNNTFGSNYQQDSSNNNQIEDNTFNPVAKKGSQAALVILGNGSNNSIRRNIIDGKSDGIFANQLGYDDGISLQDETGDFVEDNTLSNFWDCGIENSGFVFNSQINRNKISNSAYCGIGGWYFSSLKGNTITQNTVDNTPTLFTFFYYYGLRLKDTNIFFKDNSFTGNILTNARPEMYPQSSFFLVSHSLSGVSQAGIINKDERPALSSDFVTGNNIFTNNNFGTSKSAPYFDPTGMVIDGGGNTCQAGSGSVLNCTGASVANKSTAKPAVNININTTNQSTNSATTSQTSITSSNTTGGLVSVSITAAPNPAPYGSPTTLSWTSSNAVSCAAGGMWTGDKALSGSYETGPIIASFVFSITCKGADDSTAQSGVTVNNQAIVNTTPSSTGSAAGATGQQSTVEDLQKQLQDLINQLNALQGGSGLTEQPTTSNAASQVNTFDKDLYFGLKSDSGVSNLQEFLTEQGYYTGPISGNFFLLTMDAVKKFQEAQGLNPTGYFGAATRGAANNIINGLVQGYPTNDNAVANKLPAPDSSITQTQTTTTQPATTTQNQVTTQPAASSQNQTSATISTSTLPDLIVKSIEINPNPMTLGMPVNIVTTIKNIGGATASGVGLQRINKTNGAFMGQVDGMTLKAGEEYIDRSGFLSPSYFANCSAGGTNIIRVTVDYNNLVSESNESNNILENTVTLSGCSPASTAAVTTITTSSGTTSQTTIATTTASNTTASSTPAVPSVNLTTNPSTINDGSTAVISWTTSNATSCTAGDAWSGDKTTSGTYTTPSLFASVGSYTFSLNCSGTAGSTQNSVTITVNPAAPTFTFIAPVSQEQLQMGKSYNIRWQASSNTGIMSTIRLSLYKGGGYKDFIAVDVSNSGSYSWNIPTNLQTGSDYQIRIFNPNYPNNYRDSSNFSIVAASTSYNNPSSSELASMSAALANIAKQVMQLTK